MTTVMTFKHKGIIYFAADKQSSSSIKTKTTKIKKLGAVTVAACGSMEVIRLAMRAIGSIPDAEKDMLTIRNSVVDVLKDFKYIDEKEKIIKGFETYITVVYGNGTICELFLDRLRVGVLFDCETSFSGSGGDFARLLFNNLKEKSPEKLIATIFKKVSEVDLYTSEHYDLIKINLTE